MLFKKDYPRFSQIRFKPDLRDPITRSLKVVKFLEIDKQQTFLCGGNRACEYVPS